MTAGRWWGGGATMGGAEGWCATICPMVDHSVGWQAQAQEARTMEDRADRNGSDKLTRGAFSVSATFYALVALACLGTPL